MQNYAWLLLVLPLLGFAVTGALGRRMPSWFTSWIGCGVVGAAFVVAVVVFFQIRGEAPRAQFHDLTYYTWAHAGSFDLKFGFLIDPLTSVMLLNVTGVGLLIHVYSVGYMAGDPNYSRYFSYLNLFIFSMLLLGLADNYLILSIGWGLVGLSSYLLIGFWFERRSAVQAARKAFVMNVIGDVGMMIAAYLLFVHFGTLSYNRVFGNAQFMRPDTGLLNTICLMLLIGAVAKSAQIPLYTWLPDAMEGPTPVSALIHAATMVTAGVYLIARSHVLFQLAPTALASVAIIGAVGAIYAASIGLVQVDIKRVLAYSTMSQIAYMFLACGVGAYAVGIFHLMTHAFFKALLFMAAGNVIHALAGEQDMRLMGGLRGKLRGSYWLMLVGCLAISGIPPLAGFFSKDDILGRVLAVGNWHIVLWAIGVIAAGMTAFYMFRLFYLTFHGRYNGPREVYEHAHEAPRVMVVPAAILGGLSIVGLAPLAANWLAMGIALAAALIGIALAYYMYSGPVRRPYRGLRPLYQLLFNKYYVGEIYDEIFVVPVRNGARILYSIVDRETIDGLVNGVAAATRRVSLGLSPVQSGYVRAYALSIFVGVVLVALVPMVFGIVSGS